MLRQWLQSVQQRKAAVLVYLMYIVCTAGAHRETAEQGVRSGAAQAHGGRPREPLYSQPPMHLASPLSLCYFLLSFTNCINRCSSAAE